MPIKVLYIIDSLTHGGTEKQLVQLMHRFDPEKVRPHLCTLKPSEGLYDELDMPKFCLDYRSFVRPSIVKNVAALVSYVRRCRIDIVQTFFQDPFLLAAMTRPFTRAKLIGSFRDLGFWRSPAETRKMRLAYPFFDGFIANSEAVKEHFLRQDGIPGGKVSVIYNGIDLETVKTRKVQTGLQTPPIVGIVANLNRPVKRVQDFIHAAGVVHKKDPDVCFMIVGDGHLRPGFEKLALSLGIGDRITFAGRQPEPLELIQKFAVGVITSETEGFSNAIIEYMACGIPVVATGTGGNPELVTEGENGFLVPVGDIQLLAKRILQLLQNPLNNQVGLQNRAKIIHNFSLSTMVERYQDFYHSTLGSGNSR